MKTLTLKPGEDRRIRRGHLWIFSNEIADSLKNYTPGENVTILDARGKPVGSGIVNPNGLIACRLYCRKGGVELNLEVIRQLIDHAWQRRVRMGYGKVCRVVHGEADSLPGVVIDRYQDVFVIQLNSIGFALRSPLVIEALGSLFQVKTIIEANDSPARKLEGLPLSREYHGEKPVEVLWYKDNELLFPVDLLAGQKTGAYLDQTESRRLLASLCRTGRLLDAFCYTGAFGLIAAASGAAEVVLADSSERALYLATESFKRNNLRKPRCEKVDLLHSDITVSDLGGVFDFIICDPPPLIRNRNHLAEGRKKYVEVFAQALHWLKSSGLIMLFSCSYHLSREDFLEQVARAQNKCKCTVQRLRLLQASPDHPVLVGHPETEYLHGGLFEVI